MKNSVVKFVGSIGMITLLAACGGNGDEGANGNEDGGEISGGEEGKLTVALTASSEGERDTFEELIGEFEEENDIEVEASFPGGGYEDQMRVQMAANDLPDVFDTHGWSQLRYGEYTHDQQDMDWVGNMKPEMEDIVKDEDGKVYTYPVNMAQDGVIYNENILEEYDIDVPQTWDEFVSALETVRDEADGQVAPLWIAGGDGYPLGQMVDQMMTPMYETDEENDYTEELLDGSFDWSRYEWLPEQLLMLQENELLNQDVLTAKYAQAPEIMAGEQAAFMFAGGSIGPDTTALNEDVEVGIMPTPSVHEGDEPVWVGGERFALAIFEESEMKEEAEQFIEFMAEPDHAERIAEGTNLASAIEGVEADTYFSEDLERYSDTEIVSYFDRVYLPSGMWDVMSTTTEELLAGGTPEEAADTMESEYERLRDESDEE
ncbi:ABC transporter substrate-binding protein [Halobacillus sp. A5]|uniref:ABC transporter substrate-binding protein n=1 Tax=Halobacillus sp. A5 TaxID=2880263 RepID=UPI0020A66050|nr:extracellular solute-binding protein [Halobacillus sp. A5]MCP3027939.1 extracellular solute-binding protein [Halobacillus sp. A5]